MLLPDCTTPKRSVCFNCRRLAFWREQRGLPDICPHSFTITSLPAPPLAPGHTPYVRNNTDLEQFYSWWETVFAHLEKCGVTPVTVTQLRELAFG
jgi:hypothetical protein